MAGVSGAFLTGDVFNLYVWFEVLADLLLRLLILGSEREPARRRAEIRGAEPGRHHAVSRFRPAISTVFGTLNMADIAVKAAGDRRRAADDAGWHSSCLLLA
jgi:formate hydrogenlyase subunit 3/multisubunit Na+/H+ antiporter MnhD subunit